MMSKTDIPKLPKAYDSIVTAPINFYSTFFIVPYRLKWDVHEDAFTTTSSSFQKLICGFLYLLFLVNRLWQVLHELKLLQYNEDANSTVVTQTNPIFTEVGAFPGIFVVPLLVTWLSWKCQKYFAVVATDLRKIIPKSESRRLLIAIGFSILPFINCALTFYQDVLKKHHSFFNSPMYDSIVNNIASGDSVTRAAYNLLKVGILALGFMIHLVDMTFEVYGILTLTYVIIYIMEFSKQLGECYDIQQSRILMKNMQNFVSRCNKNLTLGAMMICKFVESILLQSQFAERFLFSSGQENIYYHMSGFPFLFMSIFIWIMAAEVNRKLCNAIDKWVDKQQDSQHLNMQEKIMAFGIGNDLQRKNVGISNRFFVVTYSFIGSMIGLLMTYMLIANQSSTRIAK